MSQITPRPACDLRPGAPRVAPLDAAWTVDATLRARAGAAAVFNALGIDTCCGAGASLAEAARDAGVRTDVLIGMLVHANDTLDRGGR